MNITDLGIKPLEIPFRTSFKHASAERSVTYTLLAHAKSTNGQIGYGEGCPRQYVTHESLASCQAFFSQFNNIWKTFSELGDVRSWVVKEENTIDANPAAWCAIELALLDLFARENEYSIEKLLDLPEIDSPFFYTGVIGISDAKQFNTLLQQYQQLKLTDFKLKLSGNLPQDTLNVKAIAQLPAARIRVDANNLWRYADEAVEQLKHYADLIWAIEEPLCVGDYAGMENVARRLNKRIILDESFLRRNQIPAMQNNPNCWIANVRVSKMGGLLRSLETTRLLDQAGIPIIIGAQVGETSILTRAALTIAQGYRKNLMAQEGAFGTYLLCSDITNQPLMFGDFGKLECPPQRIGLGISVTD